jgi:hypothetical protein
MRLSQVLAAIGQQTGNRIVDFRQRFGTPQTDPEVKGDFQGASFWPTLDRVLDQAGLTVYPYGEPQSICVVASSAGHAKRSTSGIYCGPLRLEPLRIQAERDLREPVNRGLRLTVEVAWEPRLRPISLKLPLANLEISDGQGNPLEVDNRRAELEVPVTTGVTAAELTLPLGLPPRAVKRIGRLQGTLTALVPGKVETFRFDLTTAENVEKRIAGTTVILERVHRNEQAWEVRILVRFDQPQNALESHRGWILQNEAYLEGADGKRIPYGTLETTRQTESEIGLAYLFTLDAPPAGLAFVYKSPGAILASSFEFTIKDIELP